MSKGHAVREQSPTTLVAGLCEATEGRLRPRVCALVLRRIEGVVGADYLMPPIVVSTPLLNVMPSLLAALSMFQTWV